MRQPNKPGGLRSMRRIPVALTKEESAALHWLKHFARVDQLPVRIRRFRKKALHISIKGLSAEDLKALVVAFDESSKPAPKNGYSGGRESPEVVQLEFDWKSR